MLSKKAYSEVYYVISEMSEELRSKIPEKIIKRIYDRMDKKYDVNPENVEIEDLCFSEETQKILSVLYTDYIATDEEKVVIKNKERMLSK